MTDLLPTQLPTLDDRRWADLVEEGRALIPLYSPRWTDQNASDPGITLLELFAWLAEMDIYQLNRIPDTHKRKFLALVGVAPLPPSAARTVIQLELRPGSGPLRLPADVEFTGSAPGQNDAVVFRILEPVDVIDTQLAAVQAYDGRAYQNCAPRRAHGEPFYPFGADPRPGAALCLGFSQPAVVLNGFASIYIAPADAHEAGEREQILAEERARREACVRPGCDGTLPEITLPEPWQIDHHSARTVWEYSTGPGQWARLEPGDVRDSTRSLTLPGTARLRCPAVGWEAVQVGQVEQEYYYLRCRFARGAYDAAPRIAGLYLNAVPAEQSQGCIALLPEHPVGAQPKLVDSITGNGRPNQVIRTAQAPVLAGSVRVESGDTVPAEWTIRPDFYASGAGDRHVTLDAQQGLLTFGDGAHGRAIERGERVRVTYRATLAAGGNVPQGTAFTLAETESNQRFMEHLFGAGRSLARARAVLPATGGAAEESLSRAIGRASRIIQGPTRAITRKDLEHFALQTPGTRLARIFARANAHPGFPCYLAPGVITLVIVPYLPERLPRPSLELRAQVAAYLNRRRTIGTRIEVVGPVYTRVTVHARVRALRGVDESRLRARIVDRLHQFFHPLEGGPEGSGWPFGRDVLRSEVLQVIDEVEGVDHVLALEMTAGDGEPQCVNLCLGPTGLVDSGKHQIMVEGEQCPR